MKKIIVVILGISLIVVGCSGGPSQSNNQNSSLPSVTTNEPNGYVYQKAKAEFDLSSSPQGSSSTLTGKSRATCSHGQCTDWTDITVTNTGTTQFSLIQAQSQQTFSSDTNNNSMVPLVDLELGNLFDNNLISCNGFKCTSAIIRIYTTDDSGTIAGSGLYNSVSGQSVELDVSGGSLTQPTAVPYDPTDGSSLTIDTNTISASTEVLALANGNFADANGNLTPTAAGYNLSANFTQAGSGTYNAHVVIEYDLIGPPPYIVATGGTITYNGNYKVHTFTSSDSFTILSGAGSVSSLVVAGGGYGGGINNASGGGGGGGGAIYTTPGPELTIGIFPVEVGNGASFASGQNGGNSSFNGITTFGGGHGADSYESVSSGGCGGGGDINNGGEPGTGIAGQGYNGGTSSVNSSWAAGGGGAGGVGENSAYGPGAGGIGLLCSITGTSIYYGGGGGGPEGGAAGLGGGGNGGLNHSPAGNGTNGFGGGGGGNAGGSGYPGGSGGSGVVIISYQYQ